VDERDLKAIQASEAAAVSTAFTDALSHDTNTCLPPHPAPHTRSHDTNQVRKQGGVVRVLCCEQQLVAALCRSNLLQQQQVAAAGSCCTHHLLLRPGVLLHSERQERGSGGVHWGRRSQRHLTVCALAQYLDNAQDGHVFHLHTSSTLLTPHLLVYCHIALCYACCRWRTRGCYCCATPGLRCRRRQHG